MGGALNSTSSVQFSQQKEYTCFTGQRPKSTLQGQQARGQIPSRGQHHNVTLGFLLQRGAQEFRPYGQRLFPRPAYNPLSQPNRGQQHIPNIGQQHLPSYNKT